MQALQPGAEAPSFSLPSGPDHSCSLAQFRGRPVVLVFYPADWSPVCSDQLALYNELTDAFKKFHAQLIGISVDGIWSHRAFSQKQGLSFPLLSDFEPKGKVASAFGVYRPKEGMSERALFLIDEKGIVRWNFVSPIGVNPGADGILQALNALPAS
jgi:peroxiredoxin